VTEPGLVDLAVEAHPGQSAENGADQRDDDQQITSGAASSTAVPVAVSQPENAEPHLMPPYTSFSRCTTLCRSVPRIRAVDGS
jgi:cell division septation protein DedD